MTDGIPNVWEEEGEKGVNVAQRDRYRVSRND